MANIKKTFNFRNGVQVDEDNLIVNATGLVGIGTTIPTEALDVRGTAKVVGLVTSNEGFIGIFTAHTSSLGTVALSTSIIGAGVSIKSGIITSNSATGLVTYYGDARFLQGMPTSQWEDTDAGFGVTSIFNTGGTVGIATTNPQFSLQVGNNVNGGEKGVGISSVGNIKVSGIITATTFSGNFNGSVDSSALNATGVSTFSGDVNFPGATSGRDILWDKSQNRLEFADLAKLSFGDTTEYQMYHKPDTNDIRVELQTGTNYILMGDTIDIKNAAGNKHLITAFGNNGNDNYVRLLHNNNVRLRTNGIGVTVYNQLDTTNIVASGVITATTELNSPLVGVGTDDPATDIQVRKAGAAQIRVSSDTDAAIVSVGRVAGASNGANAAFRYGNNSAGFPYSNSNALDIINYDTGNINFYLNGSATGYFHWHKGANGSRLMTLTNTGRLGIGSTAPTQSLDVDGSGVFTGTVTALNQTVNNNLNVTGTITGNVTGNLTGNVTGTALSGNLTGTVNATSGISTFREVHVTQSRLGVGAQATEYLPFRFDTITIDKMGALAGITSVTVAHNPDANPVTASAIGVNFADAGDPTKRFMVPPKVDNTARGNLSGLVSGAMIYNTSLNKLQVYTGSGWETVTSS